MPETNLEHNAAEAVKVIAVAADLALQKIAVAQELVDKTNSKPTGTFAPSDHDELVKLIQCVEDFHDEMRRSLSDLKNNYQIQLSDHENRINTLESANTKQNVMLTIGTSLLFILTGLLMYHMFGIKP